MHLFTYSKVQEQYAGMVILLLSATNRLMTVHFLHQVTCDLIPMMKIYNYSQDHRSVPSFIDLKINAGEYIHTVYSEFGLELRRVHVQVSVYKHGHAVKSISI